MHKKLIKVICSLVILSLCGCQTAAPSDTGTPVPSATAQPLSASVTASIKNTWTSGSSYYSQYDLSIASLSDQKINSWTIHVKADGLTLDNHWNCNINTDTSDWSITSADYNQTIDAGASLKDIGLIVYGAENAKLEILSTDIILADGSSMTIDASSAVKATPSPSPTAAVSTAQSVPSITAAGALHVSGTQLMNDQDQPVQLKGVSTHGIAWYPQYVNEDAFASLQKDWGVNVVRLAMYTGESGGYCNGGDQTQLKQIIDDGVQAAVHLGMYVIIDWHILSDGNPQQNQSQAETFFDEMSKKYANVDNVLYEICNEPQNSPWSSVIKPYAEDIIPIIRANSPNSVILVGTNTWSQDVDEVIGNTLSYDNVMYTMHFYAGTHKDALRAKMAKALDAGVPVFVSECSICDASGNGGIDTDSAQAWLDLLNTRKVSYIAWSLSNKAETSALIQSSCTKTSGWSQDDLSETGKWFYHAISSQ